MPSPFLLTFMQWARGLRFPTLFKLTAALFAVGLAGLTAASVLMMRVAARALRRQSGRIE